MHNFHSHNVYYSFTVCPICMHNMHNFHSQNVRVYYSFTVCPICMYNIPSQLSFTKFIHIMSYSLCTVFFLARDLFIVIRRNTYTIPCINCTMYMHNIYASLYKKKMSHVFVYSKLGVWFAYCMCTC